jgi:hypothetical protein
MRTGRLAAVFCALALSACALKDMPPREEIAKQALPNLTPPPQWAAAGATAGPVADDWLVSLNDPWLNELVKEAVGYNADLRIAAARVDAAVAYLAAAKSPAWPQVNLVARGGGEMSGDSSGLSGVGLFASWELDLWGRVRAAARSTVSVQIRTARRRLRGVDRGAHHGRSRRRIAAGEAQAEACRVPRAAPSLARDRLRVGSGDNTTSRCPGPISNPCTTRVQNRSRTRTRCARSSPSSGATLPPR